MNKFDLLKNFLTKINGRYSVCFSSEFPGKETYDVFVNGDEYHSYLIDFLKLNNIDYNDDSNLDKPPYYPYCTLIAL